MASVDLVNRDPNNINDHLKIAFEDVLAESEGVRSKDCVWANSYRCFSFCKDFCYMINTLFCGLCIAMHWGCEFAIIAFCHVWCITPYFRVLELNCRCAQKQFGICVHCFLDPCCESCGLLFGAFKKN